MSKKPSSPRSSSTVDPIAQLVADNIRKLLELDDKAQAGLAILKKGGLSNGTAGRLLTPDGTALRLEYVETAARALGVQAWQLLLPDLQATKSGNVISVEGMRARQWPFPNLKREEIEVLTPLEIERLEKTIRNRVSELVEDRKDMDSNRKQAKRN